jgi:hypothetical protein
MGDDNYRDFAERYDLFFDRFGERDPDVVKFFRNLFARNAVRSVLDCHSRDPREFKVWAAHYHIMLLKDDLERLLPETGFPAVELYGSYRFEPYDKTSSDILITIASK